MFPFAFGGLLAFAFGQALFQPEVGPAFVPLFAAPARVAAAEPVGWERPRKAQGKARAGMGADTVPAGGLDGNNPRGLSPCKAICPNPRPSDRHLPGGR